MAVDKNGFIIETDFFGEKKKGKKTEKKPVKKTTKDNNKK